MARFYRASRETKRGSDRKMQRRCHYVPERHIDRFYNSGKEYSPDLWCNWIPGTNTLRRWVWTPYFLPS